MAEKLGLSIPKINGRMIQSYVGKKVSIVGKMMEGLPAEDKIKVQACDGESVLMTVFEQVPAMNSTFEFIGTVENDMSLRVEFVTAYSDNFDMDVYNKVIQLAHNEKHAGMFWQM